MALPTAALNIALSFHGLAASMTSEAAYSLVASSIRHASNLPTLAKLLAFGDTGLREVVGDTCQEWTADIVSSIRQYCGEDRALELLFFPIACVMHLREHVSAPHLDGLLLYSPSYDALNSRNLQRLEGLEPRGLWWPQFASIVDWLPFLRDYKDYLTSPLFRLGLLNVMENTNDLAKLVSIYSEALTVIFGDPTKEIWALYALMHIWSMDSQGLVANKVLIIVKAYCKLIETATTHAALIPLVKLWLCVHAHTDCDQDGAAAMLHRLVSRDEAISLRRGQYIFMNALLVIVFGSEQFEGTQREGLMNLAISQLHCLDDLGLSDFLRHARSSVPLKRNGKWTALVKQPCVRGRLLQMAPYFGRDDWASLLLETDLSCEYFRRWNTRFIPLTSATQLTEATGDKEVLQSLRHVGWNGAIPLSTLGGIPVRQRLKSILQTLLDDRSLFIQHSFGEPNRLWVRLARLFSLGSDLFYPQYDAIQLLLRINLLYEDKASLSSLPSNEKVYDLCAETVDQLRSLEAINLYPALLIVYPPTPGETARSRRCLA